MCLTTFLSTPYWAANLSIKSLTVCDSVAVGVGVNFGVGFFVGVAETLAVGVALTEAVGDISALLLEVGVSITVGLTNPNTFSSRDLKKETIIQTAAISKTKIPSGFVSFTQEILSFSILTPGCYGIIPYIVLRASI